MEIEIMVFHEIMFNQKIVQNDDHIQFTTAAQPDLG